ncbi:hypothetical protein D3C72_1456990 [compost metagenome]
MLAQKGRRADGVLLLAQLQQLRVFAVGAVVEAGEQDLHPRVAVGTVVQLLDDGQRLWPAGGAVQREVELRVENAPGTDVLVAQRGLEAGEQRLGLGDVGAGLARNRLQQHVALQQHAHAQQLDDFRQRQL